MSMRIAYAGKATAGFSLIELLVSVAIMGLLASAALPLAEMTVKRQKERELRIALREIRKGIDAYKLAAANNKITLQTGQSGYPPTLSDLVNGVTDISRADKPLMYFMRRIPRDPFVADMSISAANSWGKRSFDSPPDHPREGADVFDVYSTSAQTGMNGVPYSEW